MLRNDLFVPWFIEDKWGVEIIDGEFSGTVISINKLEFKDPTEEDDGNILLDYDVVKQPENKNEEDYKSKMFSDVMQIIIEDVLKEAIAIHEQETRNNDSKESDSQ